MWCCEGDTPAAKLFLFDFADEDLPHMDICDFWWCEDELATIKTIEEAVEEEEPPGIDIGIGLAIDGHDGLLGSAASSFFLLIPKAGTLSTSFNSD
jgi:hypothetical protein